jgi:hypothetical protein
VIVFEGVYPGMRTSEIDARRAQLLFKVHWVGHHGVPTKGFVAAQTSDVFARDATPWTAKRIAGCPITAWKIVNDPGLPK